jgi:hypothetical protein
MNRGDKNKAKKQTVNANSNASNIKRFSAGENTIV